MTREIKFRAWDGKQMLHVPAPTVYALERFFGFITDVTPLMQYTGLKDKNGKDIYEGDIVEAWSQGVKGSFEVRWRKDGSPRWILFPAWQSEQMWYISATHHTAGKQFISVSGEISATDREGYYDDGLTVIGNIYEHPHLLTK